MEQKCRENWEHEERRPMLELGMQIEIHPLYINLILISSGTRMMLSRAYDGKKEINKLQEKKKKKKSCNLELCVWDNTSTGGRMVIHGGIYTPPVNR